MSRLRPECRDAAPGSPPSPSYETAIYMIRDSVERRVGLAYGRLHDGPLSCAIGAFFEDNNGRPLSYRVIDEVAAYNDSIPPPFTPRQRRNRVLKWLNWRLSLMPVNVKKRSG